MRKIKLIAGACCLSVAVMGAVLGTALGGKSTQAKAYEATPSETVSTFYGHGVAFTVPSATIDCDGTAVPATKSVIIFPSGTIYDGGAHVLHEKGEYTVIYYATVNGKTVSAEIKFTVGDWKTIGDEIVPLIDETPPTLTLHERFSDKTEHKVALGERVAVPGATATDENAVSEVVTRVYYNYGTAYQIAIDVQDNVFTPTKIGRYSIEYTAVDSFGNQAQEIVHISCGVAENNVAATLTAQDFTGEAGAEVVVPECNVEGLYHDSSAVKVYAEFKGEREEIKGTTYFARNVGEYTIVYELETPFATYSTEAKLTTSDAGHSQIGTATLPKYFIKGYSYSLDDVKGYLFNAEYPEEKVAEAQMSADGGEYVAIDHKDFKIEASQTVQFKFVCGQSELQTETFKVVDVGVGTQALQAEKYFYDQRNALSVVSDKEFILYSVENGSGDYPLDFVNVVSLSTLKFTFSIPKYEETVGKTYSEMSAVEITVTDYYDRKNSVVVRYENNGGTLVLSFNNGSKTTLAKTFTETTNVFCYNNGFMDSGSGTEFAWDGSFTSDKVLLSVKIVGVTGDAGIAISSVGKQALNNTIAYDTIEPTVYVPNTRNGIREINSVVELTAAQVTDVLSPYYEKNMSFKVTAPDGSYVKSEDDVLLDGTCDVTKTYKIKLTAHGNYIVHYAYMDQNGKMGSMRYAINVPERNAPTLTLKDVAEGEVVEATLKTKIKVAEYDVSDDTTAVENLKSYVHVYGPNYQTVTLDEEGCFVAFREGDYTVYYHCYDELGNFTNVSYTVRVREGGEE